ncbi:MAG: NAD-dependent epimerase/dehydratase family protein [Solirubrobacteraceae bacterium]|jgi:UDP-glucose 4-epimerase
MISRALVTGGAGFIGSHVVDSLLADGVQVVVVDDLSSGDAQRVAPEADLRQLSIVDAAALDATTDELRPEAVFHLAAQSSVTVSVTDPTRDLRVNVQGTLNVLEAAKRHRAPVIFTSTGGALYGNDAPIPTTEDSLPAPLAPYGASKWAAEAYVNTWAASSRIPHAICRLGNVYGPRQSPHGEAGVVAIFANCIYEGRTPTMFGQGAPTRDYVHVLDVVAAMHAARGHRGTFNVATGVETSVKRLWEILAAESGTTIEPVLAPLREGELERSCISPARTREQLGFEPGIAFADGLRSTFRALVAQFETGSHR